LSWDRFDPVVEGLIERLEETVVEAIYRGGSSSIGTEQDPICVSKEEGPGRVGLAAEFAESLGDVHVEVWVRVEEP
jgi:hypothetical protein